MAIRDPPTMPAPRCTLSALKIGALAVAWRLASTGSSAYAAPAASVPKVM